MAMYLGSDKVAGNGESSCNLVTGGSAVKTGRMIDGKMEYIKRFHFTGLNTVKEHSTPFGINTADIIVTDFGGSLYSNSGNFFAINSGINSANTYDYLISLTNNNYLNIRTYNVNFSEGYINVSYIYRR